MPTEPTRTVAAHAAPSHLACPEPARIEAAGRVTTPADDEALLRLVACNGPAAPRRRLLEHAATPSVALAAGAGLWRACGLNNAQIAGLRGPPPQSLERARRWLAQPGHHLLGWHDADYPPLLRTSPGPPLALFIAGDPALLWRPSVALVGSRSPTPGGRDNAAAFARALAASGLAIASGMAAGIDTAAHHAALAVDGITLAVLGTGVDVPYPRGNAELHAAIAARGAVISEHLPGTGPRREHFPSRNRILAALSLGTLVIEAAHRSGALITARLAAECGREVMALPGSIHNPLARGCHRLIRDGACLIERPQEVVELLAPAVTGLLDDLRQRLAAPTSEGPAAARRDVHTSGFPATGPHDPDRDVFAADRDLQPGLHNRAPGVPAHHQSEKDFGEDRECEALWQALGHDPAGMDQLVERTGLTAARVSSMLLMMELEGRVAAQHGRYHRNR